MFVRTPRVAGMFAILVLLVVPTALFGACDGDEDGEPAAIVTVTSGPRATEIRDNKFETPLRVTTGSAVTWANRDGVAHNLIAKDGSFKSETLSKGDTFTHTFATAGKFQYTCAFHPGMDGVVEVE